ncbi:MAG: choice-of-anchor B family protein [Lewinellaceae bacterium]|nr:choice-of-anchor B family protein [Lewinellaceae bacterium]
MKKFVLLFTLAQFAATLVPGQTQATLLGGWHDDNLVPTIFYDNRYNEVWGTAINGREYGIIGSTAAIHIVDVTDPAMPEELFRMPGAAAGDQLIHRDFKTYKGYLYCVSDEYNSSALQIIDLNGLPNSATEVYNSNEFVVRAHNLYIDTSQARLYLLGAGQSTILLDISTPDDPQFLASYNSNSSFYMPYVHDAFIKDNIGFFNCGTNGGLRVVDFTNPTSPVLLGTLTSYPESGYNHSGWLSDDGQYYFLCDETHGTGVKVVDVSDFSDMQVVAIMQPDTWTGEIPHNCIYRDGLLYLSYYYDGLQVFDVSDPMSPTRVAFYDTCPLPNIQSYAGAWGVFPLLPSGNILISDMQEGLFVFEALGELLDLSLHLNQSQFETCAGEEVEFTLTVGEDFDAGGVALEALANLPGTSVTFNPNPALPGETVIVTITGLSATQGSAAQIILKASDGTNTNSTNIFVTVDDLPNAPALDSPFPNAPNVALTPLFDWDPAPNADSYLLEVASDAVDFEGSIVLSNTTSTTQLVPVGELNPGTLYYWRVTAQNICGGTVSDVQSFTTEGGTGVHVLTGNNLTVYPNPVKDIFLISFENPVEETMLAELSSLTGQRVVQIEIPAGQNGWQFDTAQLPTGIYLFKITNGRESLVRRIAVQH